MNYVFIFLIALVVLFVFLCIKYNNPFRLWFIFGKKGAGKTCLMVNMMIKYLRKGWNVYTDIQDILIPGVRVINPRDLESFRPAYHSLLCLDEAGLLYDNRKFKSFADGLNEFYKFQRKYKVFVVMNSQSFDIDLKIRSLVDKMILQQNIGNIISVSRPIRRSVTLTEPDSGHESRIADKLSFTNIFTWKFYYMPNYFKYFDSFSAPERPEITYREIVDGVHSFKLDGVKYLSRIRLSPERSGGLPTRRAFSLHSKRSKKTC